ncbi:MAG: hypothetical protein JXA96_08580, partial [Sedimentisphaerales bacterium]|nr:hypothetical protein [Sedimentisphaerales bacterium]
VVLRIVQMKRGLVLTLGCFIAILLVGCDSTKMGADSNKEQFYVFLCFGQSNMEGFPRTIQEQDMTVDSRFQMMAAVDMPGMDRVKGNWYDAVPPLCRADSGLCPADYFGRTLAANLPENIKVGVINVSVAGCKIECFEKEGSESYISSAAGWLKNIVKNYDNNPYQYLIDLGKQAQAEGGVIKGILLHQGESNTGDNEWPNKVKGIYDNMLADLNLKAEDVPLLAGEVVNADQRGQCAGFNNILAKLPETVPTAYVISSAGCTSAERLHFNSAGYRLLGTRYGEKMVELLGYEVAKTDEQAPAN